MEKEGYVCVGYITLEEKMNDLRNRTTLGKDGIKLVLLKYPSYQI
jgi:hypothetical protein